MVGGTMGYLRKLLRIVRDYRVIRNIQILSKKAEVLKEKYKYLRN
jgi:hypothetical protein